MSAKGVEPLPFIYLSHLSNFLSNCLVSFTPFYATFTLFHVKCRKNLEMSLAGYGSDGSVDFLNDFLEESEYTQCQ
ncbi:conserved hypothetical protein [Trichinella spiralis]|uniref:hypothetical protein n=1 Tax=Trichinella spiralis TaxID=6334 RepID=UPI0001EFE0B1|nr:conserved hypothetical protein [Trichinella spiralis]